MESAAREPNLPNGWSYVIEISSLSPGQAVPCTPSMYATCLILLLKRPTKPKTSVFFTRFVSRADVFQHLLSGSQWNMKFAVKQRPFLLFWEVACSYLGSVAGNPDWGMPWFYLELPRYLYTTCEKNNKHKHNLYSWFNKHACRLIVRINLFLFVIRILCHFGKKLCEWWGRTQETNLHIRLKADHKIIRPKEQAAQSGTHTAHGNSHHATAMHKIDPRYVTENSEDNL